MSVTNIIVAPPVRPNITVDVHDQGLPGTPGAPGAPGPPGPPGPASFYEHTQGVADTLWVIQHNLGYHPSIHTFLNDGTEFFADVTHPTDNQSNVTIAYPVSGTATAS